MPLLAQYRVRIWAQGELAAAPRVNPVTAAADETGGDPSVLATVEAENGAGEIVAVAVGIGGDGASIWTPPGEPMNFDPAGLSVRRWHVEDAFEEVGAHDLPDALLAEFHEALWEDGRRGVLLLTAEYTDQSGRPVIDAVDWYDSLEYELRLSDS